MRKLLLAIFTTVAASWWCASAAATAWVSVTTESGFDFEGYYDNSSGFEPIPDGIDVDNEIYVPNIIFGGSITIGHQEFHASGVSTFTITNNTATAFDGYLVYQVTLGPFNPGGNPVGASVDDPNTEFASFYSYVQILEYSSYLGCHTALHYPTCGVDTPDNNSDDDFLPIPAPGQTETFYGSYQYDYVLDVHPAPEAPTAPLFAAGLVILGMSASWRSSKRRVRHAAD